MSITHYFLYSSKNCCYKKMSTFFRTYKNFKKISSIRYNMAAIYVTKYSNDFDSVSEKLYE